ncbi:MULTISPECIES: hypothetical protein [Sphingobium]|jgi:hypothetical protein|uniref:hypothetical protein n=1 Tax=Sphingobium TaxID=165695 RepID=UPI000DBB846D|nr:MULTISPECIES: hypothetical protein [Sphingobium]KAA9017285.1 hypothetical protein F4U94_08655 [Sphingobium limneticum]MBU0933266.1 hypothetical protein [Alphaproteobacteria bacterium]BBD01206.1 hypothetical protein YGS_C1P2461 [Sphingobium sp. YG1]
MPIDEVIEAIAFTGRLVVGAVDALQAVGMVAEHIFSGHTARFFHGVGRRVIAVATFGTKRIPSSLRVVPKGSHPKPRRSDWLALWVGILFWVALFFAIGLGVSHFL